MAANAEPFGMYHLTVVPTNPPPNTEDGDDGRSNGDDDGEGEPLSARRART